MICNKCIFLPHFLLNVFLLGTCLCRDIKPADFLLGGDSANRCTTLPPRCKKVVRSIPGLAPFCAELFSRRLHGFTSGSPASSHILRTCSQTGEWCLYTSRRWTADLPRVQSWLCPITAFPGYSLASIAVSMSTKPLVTDRFQWWKQFSLSVFKNDTEVLVFSLSVRLAFGSQSVRTSRDLERNRYKEVKQVRETIVLTQHISSNINHTCVLTVTSASKSV